MKYNRYTHWLYNKSEKNTKLIINQYDKIKKELIQLEDYNEIECLFRELYKNVLKNNNFKSLEYKNNCDIETFISLLLSDYIVIMNRMVKNK